MILQIQELRVEGKKNEEIIPILVRYINTLTSSVNFALQNIGFDRRMDDRIDRFQQLMVCKNFRRHFLPVDLTVLFQRVCSQKPDEGVVAGISRLANLMRRFIRQQNPAVAVCLNIC